MKKLILFFLSLSVSLMSFAQFTLTINDENVEDGAVFEYNTLGEDVELDFIVTSTNDTEDIKMAMTVQSITNNSAGSNLQFCWDLCYALISVDSQYPTNGATLAPGASTAPFGNHFLNNHTGDDPNVPVTYELMFHEIDEEGNVMGSPITITYIYNATLSIEDSIEQVAYKLYPSVMTDSFTLELEEDAQVTILTLNGTVVAEWSASAGSNAIDVSSLASQMYYVMLSSSNEKKALTKIIIK